LFGHITEKWLVKFSESFTAIDLANSLMKRVSSKNFGLKNMSKKTLLGMRLFRGYLLGYS